MFVYVGEALMQKLFMCRSSVPETRHHKRTRLGEKKSDADSDFSTFLPSSRCWQGGFGWGRGLGWKMLNTRLHPKLVTNFCKNLIKWPRLLLQYWKIHVCFWRQSTWNFLLDFPLEHKIYRCFPFGFLSQADGISRFSVGISFWVDIGFPATWRWHLRVTRAGAETGNTKDQVVNKQSIVW